EEFRDSAWRKWQKPRAAARSAGARSNCSPHRPMAAPRLGGGGHVFFLRVFLRALGVDARRWLRWILNPPRRSFKLRVLVDRQRPMKNVTLHRPPVLQPT